MKSTTSHFVAAALAVGSLAHSRTIRRVTSPHADLFREDIKSGKGSAHQKVEAAYVRAFSKSGYPSYLALDDMTHRWKTLFTWPRVSRCRARWASWMRR